MPYEGQAAVLNEDGRDVEVEDITIDDPGPGEVLVKLAASGVCHTDLTVKNLHGNGMPFPIVLGHEGRRVRRGRRRGRQGPGKWRPRRHRLPRALRAVPRL